MAKKIALVTLTKALSMVVGRHRFEKGKTVRVTDETLIEALQSDGSFVVKVSEEKDDAVLVKGKVLKEPPASKGADLEVQDAKLAGGKGK